MGDKARARARELANAPKVTKSQVAYLDSLLLRWFSTRVQRNDYLSRETDREIKYLDELTLIEASKLIDTLVERRDRERGHGAYADD